MTTSRRIGVAGEGHDRCKALSALQPADRQVEPQGVQSAVVARSAQGSCVRIEGVPRLRERDCRAGEGHFGLVVTQGCAASRPQGGGLARAHGRGVGLLPQQDLADGVPHSRRRQPHGAVGHLGVDARQRVRARRPGLLDERPHLREREVTAGQQRERHGHAHELYRSGGLGSGSTVGAAARHGDLAQEGRPGAAAALVTQEARDLLGHGRQHRGVPRGARRLGPAAAGEHLESVRELVRVPSKGGVDRLHPGRPDSRLHDWSLLEHVFEDDARSVCVCVASSPRRGARGLVRAGRPGPSASYGCRQSPGYAVTTERCTSTHARSSSTSTVTRRRSAVRS